jgi:hypothetical protein
MYVDVNNLYGWAMMEYLPFQNFRWVEDVNDFDVTKISDTSDIGYILEVDLEYPQNIHDHDKDLPFCCEHLKPPDSKISKLMTTLYNKTKYIIHYRTLKQVLSNGLILTKIYNTSLFDEFVCKLGLFWHAWAILKRE